MLLLSVDHSPYLVGVTAGATEAFSSNVGLGRMGSSFQTGSEIDVQANGKCIKLFNCLEIQHNEHPKVSYY